MDSLRDAPAAASTEERPERAKTNVLYLNHTGQVSGAEHSLLALLRQLRRSDAQVEPVVALPGAGPFSELLRDGEWSVTFAPMRRLQRPHNFVSGMSALVHILRTAPHITNLVRKTHSQLVHSNSTTAHLVGGLAAERAGVPAIWHARDLVSLERIAPALALRANAVIAISGCVAQRLERDGVPNSKIRVIYNGLDPDEWRPREKSQLRASLGLPKDAFLFGCVSQLVPWKNHAAFIEAAGTLVEEEGCAGARFAIVGGDLWDEHLAYVSNLRGLVKKYGLRDRFNFVPHQVNNVDALAAMDAVVLPSREEPFGRVLIEAMALGKPVIAYAEGGPLEIVTQGGDGLLVSPEQEGGLAEAMRRVLLDAGLRQELGRNARSTVVERFHIADSAQSVLDLYHSLLG